ncbi:hypothetical protein FJU31_04150 [Stenotrophomonas cyclobalanopsidis]|uniref:Uncharacterized protein n=1 Tax=Stenotrophomonas cyclobalanopsidis TaxID=2771362 RepID=A0ABQ6T491_9GAMM|nr:hypothetical protein [Stenotrophomonas cyclobalanopsidis]KAA9003502.1 hypothetical protein FJU31_04150 [Stenotrophomonas cyclobalanopsidis]
MSRQYRDEQLQLGTHLSTLERAAEEALAAARTAYPPGALCIVRSQRCGYAVVEREAKIISTVAELHVTHSGRPWASITVRTKNLRTGKVKAFYPSVEVAGKPSIRTVKPCARYMSAEVQA